MNDKTGPIEPVVTIPIGMDCSHTEWRHRPDMTTYIQSLIDDGQTIPAGAYKIKQTIALAATDFIKSKREHLSNDHIQEGGD